ncbi:MAG: DUF4928 domain-containing protein [Chloroflexi bacterium]|nr:DUF4928 domain-containing protein [Chloroflexota bacterium]
MNEQPTDLVEHWHEAEAARGTSPKGVPNTGLHVLEIFREQWPLDERHYLTEGGGQVKGLSGHSGDIIIRRYAPNFRSIGTEAGRTSRSTPGAAQRLAARLNELPATIGNDRGQRADRADRMQRWIVNEVLARVLAPRGPAIEILDGEPLERALNRHLDDAAGDITWVRAAERLLAATIDVVTRDADVPHGDQLRLGDTALVLSELPTMADVETCAAAVADQMRCLLLTPNARVLASAQLLEANELDAVEVESASRFVARLIDIPGRFEPVRRDEMIHTLNERL